ncbi:transglutaminase-like putative cysteine protease [Azospirillum fermentarium]|uniref:transglutaminase family protein n=1 Tax=Azospirillum fermentarium TaxID=1233114 RepID=UPI0022278D61|nr:transglutaminase family protein [Azospirillum fermentarium]MCW2247576.1 transglutaminase-like putative cysteine protease [Azospirillum fermentarium]
MLYRCRHTTRYDYGEAVPVSHHMVHLAPRPRPGQTVHWHRLTVSPGAAVMAEVLDYFGNPVSYLAVQEPHRVLDITTQMEVTVDTPPPFDAAATPPWEAVRDEAAAVPGDRAADIVQFLFDSLLVRPLPEMTAYAAPSFPPGRPAGEAMVDLMRRIHADFTFDPMATTVATPLAEVMAKRRGVCQDFAHLLCGMLRGFGIPARYVSGYLRTLPPPGQPRLVGADMSHAWVSAWWGGGWIDLCPTNNRLADADYITLAWGRDYDDVSPVRGVIIGGYGHHLTVEVDVEPLDGDCFPA